MRSAVILAGGNSLRLGVEKSLLVFEDKPLICWTLETLFQAADEVIVVARDKGHAERLEKIISRTKADAGLQPSPKLSSPGTAFQALGRWQAWKRA